MFCNTCRVVSSFVLSVSQSGSGTQTGSESETGSEPLTGSRSQTSSDSQSSSESQTGSGSRTGSRLQTGDVIKLTNHTQASLLWPMDKLRNYISYIKGLQPLMTPEANR